ncbi:MAG: hypothetical protein ACFCU1_06085 [Sumerlaeia bacterium]
MNNQRFLLLTIILVCFANLNAQSTASAGQFYWCGNHLHDPSQPKGISIWAKSQLEKSVKTPVNYNKGAAFGESEPNNTRQTAPLFPIINSTLTVQGQRTLPFSRPAATVTQVFENNDSISTASNLNLATGFTNGRRVVNQTIGDGQFGTTSGDFDFYSFSGEPGELYLFDVDSTSLFDPIIAIYSSNGTLLAISDDEVPMQKVDPYFTWTPETAGTYYLCVASVSQETLVNNFPANPFQPGTGRGAGLGGTYNLEVFRLTPIITAFEENGVIQSAIPIINSQNTVAEFIIEGFIGDSFVISGDFDLFRFNAAQGQVFTFDVFTSDPSAQTGLDPVIGVYNSNGILIDAAGDKDAEAGNLDPRLVFSAPSAGFYYLVIGAQVIQSEIILDLNFPSNGFTGIGGGPASVGFYTILVSTLNTDEEWFEFDLEEGQVFSARTLGAARVMGVEGPAGNPIAYTTQNVNGFSAKGTPLVNGEISLSFVVPETGRYAMNLLSFGTLLKNGPWQVDILLSEPGLRGKFEGEQQIIFLDFDGASVDASLLTGPNRIATLSPLSAFLPAWGIPANQESALIDSIIATMEENLNADMIAKGGNGDFNSTGNGGEFGITFLNSRDHADPFGQPNVSRVIFGGTRAELGVQTIGIAESIDPGNFNHEETAVVLLDLLSEPADQPSSLNQFTLAGGRTKIDLVGVAVGNIGSHEVGHFVGNWHTINNNAQQNIMDQGGIISNAVGVGPDSIFGNLNDIDVDFETDQYEPSEVYIIGFEDTLKATVYGLSTGTNIPPVQNKDAWLFY